MNRNAEIRMHDQTTGWLVQNEEGYHFTYDEPYLNGENPEPISLTMPLQKVPYSSRVMLPFFDGLIPEGWLLDIAQRNWKLNPRDRMGLLLACCKDCIGAVSVHPVNEEA